MMIVKQSIIFSLVLTAWAETIPVSLEQHNVRMTYETVILPHNEAMGLAGLNYQQMFGSYWYGGLGIYGSAAGKRGGFFTGGFEGGVRYPLVSNIEVETGLFIGGGGGGAAPQGGGLMIRPHVGVSYGTSDIRAGVQLSRVEFPNGDIKSTQIGGVIDIPFESFRLDGEYRGRLNNFPNDITKNLQRSIQIKQGEFGVEVQHYTPLQSSLKTDGTILSEPFDTLGVRYSNSLSRNVAWHLATAGAMGGGADGYAEIFAGMGWRYGIFDAANTKSRLFFNIDSAIGMGGGGQIDTGGGAMGKVSAGLSYKLTPEWSVDTRGGYVRSFEGNFAGRMLTCSFNHTFATFSPSMDLSLKNVYGDSVIRRDWRVHAIHETYTSALSKSKDSQTVSLVGMQIDVLSSKKRYLYGKGLGAYNGGAGGYASGTLGLGLNYSLATPIELYAQAGAGAGGGGGLDVGSGLIAEAEAGVRYEIASNTDLMLGTGITRSMSGGLDTPTLQIGVTYRFGTLGSRKLSY